MRATWYEPLLKSCLAGAGNNHDWLAPPVHHPRDAGPHSIGRQWTIPPQSTKLGMETPSAVIVVLRRSPHIQVADYRLLRSTCGGINESTEDARPVDEINAVTGVQVFFWARTGGGPNSTPLLRPNSGTIGTHFGGTQVNRSKSDRATRTGEPRIHQDDCSGDQPGALACGSYDLTTLEPAIEGRDQNEGDSTPPDWPNRWRHSSARSLVH